MSSSEKDEDMIYGLTADDRDALLEGLRALPDTMPPRVVWRRIREQAEAEGLVKKPYSRRVTTWYAGGSLAAAALVAAVIVPGWVRAPDVELPSVPPTTSVGTVQVNGLQSLMVESRQLESDLRLLPSEPRLVRAGTRATILEIEDRIAAIDYQLNDADVQMMSAADREIFWRERVRLMKSLVRLRYAQAQRTAF